MDNASFHHSERIEQLCSEAGVKLVYLPPYSPDLNPIEEFFAELKAFIRRNWQSYEENPDQGFDSFLEWCVDVVGVRGKSAEGHFRHSGLTLEELWRSYYGKARTYSPWLAQPDFCWALLQTAQYFRFFRVSIKV